MVPLSSPEDGKAWNEVDPRVRKPPLNVWNPSSGGRSGGFFLLTSLEEPVEAEVQILILDIKTRGQKSLRRKKNDK